MSLLDAQRVPALTLNVFVVVFGRDEAWTRRFTTRGVHGVEDTTAAGAGDGWGGDAVGGGATGPGLYRVDLGTRRPATR